MEVTFVTNISKSSSMLNMLRLLLISLRTTVKLHYKVAVVIDYDISIEQIFSENPWLSSEPCYFVNTPREYNQRFGYLGNFIYRFQLETKTESIIFCDADLVVVGDIIPAIKLSVQDGAIYGVAAGTVVNEGVKFSLEECGLASYQYDLMESAGWGTWLHLPERLGFPHYNCGVLFATREIAQEIAKNLVDYMEVCRRNIPHVLYVQLAISMTLIKAGISMRCLPYSYNMAIHQLVTGQLELEDPYALRKRQRIRDAINSPCIIHFCVESPYLNKSKDFVDKNSMMSLMNRDYRESHVLFHLQKFISANAKEIFGS